MELAFEQLRYLDLYRWRIAEKVMNYPNYGLPAKNKARQDAYMQYWFHGAVPEIDESGCPISAEPSKGSPHFSSRRPTNSRSGCSSPPNVLGESRTNRRWCRLLWRFLGRCGCRAVGSYLVGVTAGPGKNDGGRCETRNRKVKGKPGLVKGKEKGRRRNAARKGGRTEEKGGAEGRHRKRKQEKGKNRQGRGQGRRW